MNIIKKLHTCVALFWLIASPLCPDSASQAPYRLVAYIWMALSGQMESFTVASALK